MSKKNVLTEFFYTTHGCFKSIFLKFKPPENPDLQTIWGNTFSKICRKKIYVIMLLKK